MAKDFVEGTLRTDYTIDNIEIYLKYDSKLGYSIQDRFFILSKCQTLEEAEIVFDTMCLSEINCGKFMEVSRAAKIEHRRLTPLCSIRGQEWDTPASRHNQAVYGALRRLEGYRPQSHKGFTKWIKTA